MAFNTLIEGLQRSSFELIFRLLGMRTKPPKDLASVKRILVIRTESKMGDVILATPFLRELRHNAKQAEITLLIHPVNEALFSDCPYVDHILLYPRWKPRPFGQIRRMFHEIAWARKFLWPSRFEMALITRSHQRVYREGALAFLSGAPARIAVRQDPVSPWKNDAGEERFYTQLTLSQPKDHEVQRNLSLLSFLDGTIHDTKIELWLSDEERSSADGVIPDDPKRPTRIAMMVGSSVPGRRWPAERFASLAAWITSEFGWQVVLIGSKAEAAYAKVVEAACAGGIVNLTGRTSLRQTLAVLVRCELYIGNDTGPMHMAVAFGLPITAISCHPQTGAPFNERSPERFGPFGVSAWIAQPVTTDRCTDYCYPGEQGEAHCILNVTVDHVSALVREAAMQCGLPLGELSGSTL